MTASLTSTDEPTTVDVEDAARDVRRRLGREEHSSTAQLVRGSDPADGDPRLDPSISILEEGLGELGSEVSRSDGV